MSQPDTFAALTVGTFDGVHRGHRLLLARLVAHAAAQKLRSVIVTFSPHPLEVVNPAAAPLLLTTEDEKGEALADAGADEVVVLPFTPELSRLDAAQFVDQVLVERLRVRSILVGYDHGLGRGRSGDVDVLRGLGASRGFDVEVVPAVLGRDGRPVSSTSLRRAVAGGDLLRASDGLGRPYSASGVVLHGEERGRSLGFRTLNLGAPSPRKLIPPEGVYAVRATTRTGTFGGMLNLGPRPTFGDKTTSLEVHLFDAEGDWYGTRVRVEFLQRLRDVRAFDGPAALVRQLHEDAEKARLVVARVRAGI